MPNLEAEEKFFSLMTITASNIKSMALKAGYSLSEANRFENELLLRELKK